MKNPILLPPFSAEMDFLRPTRGRLMDPIWKLFHVFNVTFKQTGRFLARITTLATYEEHAYLSTEAR